LRRLPREKKSGCDDRNYQTHHRPQREEYAGDHATSARTEHACNAQPTPRGYEKQQKAQLVTGDCRSQRSD
jgi:hypothetical protein